jgi:hypothetical protein
MIALKAGILRQLDTPEKARTVLSNIALAGGLVGVILMIVGVLVARA